VLACVSMPVLYRDYSLKIMMTFDRPVGKCEVKFPTVQYAITGDSPYLLHQIHTHYVQYSTVDLKAS